MMSGQKHRTKHY